MHRRFIPCPVLESNPEILYAKGDGKLFCLFAFAFKMAFFPRRVRCAHQKKQNGAHGAPYGKAPT
jgi:hypothetical protein